MLGKEETIKVLEAMIEKQQEEILFLRGMVKELQDRLMAFNERAFNVFKQGDLMKAEVPAPTYVDPLGMVQSMAANTEEEKKQKQEAMEQVTQILGAHA